MLGKTKKTETDTTITVSSEEELKPSAPSPKPTPTREPESTPSEKITTIGDKISIEGQIKGEEHLVIEGSLKGNVEMQKHNFKVGSNGRVDGEVRAQNVSISGQLQGTIQAQSKIEITKEADFVGDIKAQSISVEDGAYFKGSIELNREPHRKSTPATAPKSALGTGTDTKKET